MVLNLSIAILITVIIILIAGLSAGLMVFEDGKAKLLEEMQYVRQEE